MKSSRHQLLFGLLAVGLLALGVVLIRTPGARLAAAPTPVVSQPTAAPASTATPLPPTAAPPTSTPAPTSTPSPTPTPTVITLALDLSAPAGLRAVIADWAAAQGMVLVTDTVTATLSVGPRAGDQAVLLADGCQQAVL